MNLPYPTTLLGSPEPLVTHPHTLRTHPSCTGLPTHPLTPTNNPITYQHHVVSQRYAGRMRGELQEAGETCTYVHLRRRRTSSPSPPHTVTGSRDSPPTPIMPLHSFTLRQKGGLGRGGDTGQSPSSVRRYVLGLLSVEETGIHKLN